MGFLSSMCILLVWLSIPTLGLLSLLPQLLYFFQFRHSQGRHMPCIVLELQIDLYQRRTLSNRSTARESIGSYPRDDAPRRRSRDQSRCLLLAGISLKRWWWCFAALSMEMEDPINWSTRLVIEGCTLSLFHLAPCIVAQP